MLIPYKCAAGPVVCVYSSPPPSLCSFCWIDYFMVPMSLFGFSSQEHVGGGQVKKREGLLAVSSLARQDWLMSYAFLYNSSLISPRCIWSDIQFFSLFPLLYIEDSIYIYTVASIYSITERWSLLFIVKFYNMIRTFWATTTTTFSAIVIWKSYTPHTRKKRKMSFIDFVTSTCIHI